jgi:hypothetical protein
VTVDRPIPAGQPGFTPEICRAVLKPDRHYEVDLNETRLNAAYGDPPIGTADLVLCTEVLEHLVVNAPEFLGDLLRLLRDDGHLYLTTPNFFSHHRLEQIRRRENPQDLFPPRGANWDAHFHFREYCMTELLDFVTRAGGRVEAAYFSDCWDGPEVREQHLAHHPERRSNIVVVARASLSP